MDLRKRKQSRRRFKHHSSFRFRGPLPAGSVHPPKRLSRLSSSAAPAFLLGYLFVRTHQTNLAPVSAKSDSNIPATAAAPSPAAPAEPILLDRLLITTWLGGGDDLSNRTLGAIKLMTSIRRSGKAPPGTDFGLLVSGLAPLGARAERMVVAVGPCIGQASYEVAADLRDAVLAENAEDARFFTDGARPERWQFDLAGYCAARLRAAGVGAVEVLGVDTLAAEGKFFSHRRRTLAGGGPIGHQMSAIVL